MGQRELAQSAGSTLKTLTRSHQARGFRLEPVRRLDGPGSLRPNLKLDKDEVANDIVQHFDALGASMALRADPINQKVEGLRPAPDVKPALRFRDAMEAAVTP